MIHHIRRQLGFKLILFHLGWRKDLGINEEIILLRSPVSDVNLNHSSRTFISRKLRMGEVEVPDNHHHDHHSIEGRNMLQFFFFKSTNIMETMCGVE